MNFNNMRFELINHSSYDCRTGFDFGRVVVQYGVDVQVVLQDDGRTIKVFLADPE